MHAHTRKHTHNHTHISSLTLITISSSPPSTLLAGIPSCKPNTPSCHKFSTLSPAHYHPVRQFTESATSPTPHTHDAGAANRGLQTSTGASSPSHSLHPLHPHLCPIWCLTTGSHPGLPFNLCKEDRRRDPAGVHTPRHVCASRDV